MQPKRNKKRGTRKGQSLKSYKTQLKHELRGVELKVSPNPPPITTRPWFNLTVRLEGTGTLNSRDVINAINTQLGFSIADNAIGISIQRIKVWGPLVPFTSSTALQPISISFIDFISVSAASAINNNRVLEQFTRYPDQTRRASVGYSFPIAHQDVVLTSVSTANVTPIFYASGLGAGSVVYVYLKWRSSLISFPTVVEDFEHLQI